LQWAHSKIDRFAAPCSLPGFLLTRILGCVGIAAGKAEAAAFKPAIIPKAVNATDDQVHIDWQVIVTKPLKVRCATPAKM
jgi:hypothetical protein